ncbi:DUF397 domain-containing protein [Nocardia goodfellowii]
MRDLNWRVSSYSDNGTCVQVAKGPNGNILVRNSNRPDAGTVEFTPAEVDAFFKGAAAGEFEDLRS